MLNSKALNEVLSRNSDGRICKRWSLMTLNGALLAYTHPTDIRDLRRQATLAILSWQECKGSSKSGVGDSDFESARIISNGALHTLTIESETTNTIIRMLPSQLLLVLEGGVPPRREGFDHRLTPEGSEDAAYPPLDEDVDSLLSSSVGSSASLSASSVLVFQRRKLDALAKAIAEDLQDSSFKMPEEGSSKFF